MSATETSLSPAWRMMPSSSSRRRAPNCSSRGTRGSIRWSCQRSICSTPSFLRLPLACAIRYGASIGDPLVRTRTRQTRLGSDKQSFIGVKGLADQFLRNIGTVTVGGVDEVDADLMKPAQRRKRCATVRRRTPDARSGETHRAVAETVDSGVSDLELTGGAGIDRPHDRELQDVNIAFFDFVSWAGTSACMTSQCSTSRPF